MSKMELKEVSISELPKVNDNPWGLVYKDAITKNEAGKVNIHPISYILNGLKIAANIYTPANYDPNKKYPALTVAHPNGGVKEQVAGLFAQRMAQQGYITITADASYQGGSEGEPRMVDNPAFRVEDIHGMADALSLFPGVDYDRMGAFGICGGGGYTLRAGQTDKRFKTVATLSAFNSGLVRRNGFFAYAISFFWIGLMWVSHHNNWQLVHIIDMKTIMLTLVLLFFASLFPYTTSLVAENFNNSTAQVFYGLIIIAISLLNVALSKNLGRLNPKAHFGLLYKTSNKVVFVDLGIKFIGLILAITVYPAAMIYSIFIASLVLGSGFSREKK